MFLDEKMKFEIIGKFFVKYIFKVNYEVEVKCWFWLLNNLIQWMKDQVCEEECQVVCSVEFLKQVKVEQGSVFLVYDFYSENVSMFDLCCNSF